MAEGISPRRLRKTTHDVRQQSESMERQRQTEREIRALEKQIKEQQLKRLQHQQEMMRSGRMSASASRQTDRNVNKIEELQQETKQRFRNFDQQNGTQSRENQGDVPSSQGQIQEERYMFKEPVIDVSDIAFSPQVEALDKRFSSYNQEMYSTPDRKVPTSEHNLKIQTDVARLKLNDKRDREKWQSMSFDTGFSKHRPSHPLKEQPLYKESELEGNMREKWFIKEDSALDTADKQDDWTKWKHNQLEIDSQTYAKKQGYSDDWGGKQEDKSETTELLELEERKLLVIRQRRKELQGLLELERGQQLKIEQEKQRRVQEIERQKQLLEQYEIRERELALREQNLDKYEQELETKLKELQQVTGIRETENKDMNESNSIELLLKRKEDEMRKKEEALNNREKELEDRETLFKTRYTLLKELQHIPIEKDTIKHKDTAQNTEVKKKITEHEKEPERKELEDVNPKKNKEEDIHTFGPKLNISQFSGADPKPKSESSFEEWKREIESVIATRLYKEHVIAQAIRHSLKGQAKKALINLHPTASPIEIVARVEDIFGDLSSQQFIYTEFYTAEQKPDESIAEWGLRLEEILLLASNKRQIPEKERNAMLKDKFWRSLYNQEIKNATRNSFESSDSFEVLRRKARAEENEMKLTKQRKQHTETKLATSSETEKSEDMLAKLMRKMEDFEKKLQDIKEDKQKQDTSGNKYNRYGGSSSFNRGRGHYYGGYRGGYRYDNNTPQNQGNKKEGESSKENIDKNEKKNLND
ncbi:trichohyalin-like [Mercenaria mercenaria]|uniref:trichohyalin-like n=1 Tax=Mercenaria mercenaria TaxID=6596 RepID=UPI00234E9171|nr:trichohyalin-like [Mercenaria mercenaria]